MARQHLESPQSSRSLHLTLVINIWTKNPWSRPCMWSTVEVTWLAQQPIHSLPSRSHGWLSNLSIYYRQGHMVGSATYPFTTIKVTWLAQRPIHLLPSRLHGWLSNLSIYYHQGHMVGSATYPFTTIKVTWLAQQPIHLLPSRSHGWLRNLSIYFHFISHQNVCFLFHSNWTLFGWDVSNAIFYLENLMSRPQQKLTKI